MGYDSTAGAALKAAVEERILPWPDVRATVLFGFPAYRVEDTVFAVLEADAVVLTRLPTGGREELVDEHDVGPFEAYGQTIGSWVRVETAATDLDELVPFVRESYRRARVGTAVVPPPEEDRSRDGV